MATRFKGKSRGGRGMRGAGQVVHQLSAVAEAAKSAPGRDGEYLKTPGSTTPEKQARRADRLQKQAREPATAPAEGGAGG